MVSSVARWDDEAHRRRPLRAAHPGDRDESAVAERIIEDEVRELVRRREMDPGGDAVAADRVIGLGPLQGYFDDPEIEEIWINQPDKVFVAKAGRPILTGTVLSEEQVHDLVELMLRASGRRVDLSSPFVAASLADGSRLHVVIPDVTRRHWAVNVRKFVVRANRLDELVRLGTMTPQCARFLEASVVAGINLAAAGAAGDLRGGFRAPDRSTGRRGDADPAAQPRRPRRDSAAPARQGGAPDAPEPPDRGRGAAGGDARPADRVEQRHRRNDLAARQLRARGARQAGHAAVAGRREHHASVHRPDGGGGHRSDRVPAVRPRWAPSGRRGDRGTGPGRRWRDRVAAAVLPGRRRAAVDRALSAARGALPRRRHRPWRGALRMRRAAQ